MHARLEGRQRGFIENELKSIELIEQFLTPVITLNHDSVTREPRERGDGLTIPFGRRAKPSL